MKFSKGRKNLRGINLFKEEGTVTLREIHVQVPGRVANSGHGQSTLACSETHSSQLGWLWAVNCTAKVCALCWEPWDGSGSWRLRWWVPDVMARGGRDTVGSCWGTQAPWPCLGRVFLSQHPARHEGSPTSLLCPPPHNALNSSSTHPVLSSGLHRNLHPPLKPMYPFLFSGIFIR